MTETATRELGEAAPAAFVNGDATHQAKPGPVPQRVANRRPRRDPAPAKPDESAPANGSHVAWPDGLATALRLHEAWRDGVTMLAREQLDYLADAGRDMLAAGGALAVEPDPARCMELVCSQALRQFERSLETSARLIGILSSPGRKLLDAEAWSRRPG